MKNFLTILLFLLCLTVGKVFGYSYEKRAVDSHVLHIVRLSPVDYEAQLVKAGGDTSRETVSMLAARFKADIAINGGFFKITEGKASSPSGTLVIKGKVYGLKDSQQSLLVIRDGKVSISHAEPKAMYQTGASMVSGIPMLLRGGEIPPELFSKSTDFYSLPHARTAVGLTESGEVVIVVAENELFRWIQSVTMGDLVKLFKENGKAVAARLNKARIDDITIGELRQVLTQGFAASKDNTKGLTILELAKLMKELGCRDAINLDGGGSSTLWIKGSVVNNVIGDLDEAAGQNVERPVLDAIIFRKK